MRNFNPSANSVANTVRRCDFMKLQEYHTVLGMDYYQKSLEYMSENIAVDEIYIFSDDLNWYRSNFLGNKFHFVKGDIGIQFFKITIFNHIILGNSSFSWWGAYLNRHVQNVIFPLNWFGPKNANKFSYDLLPNDWIGIK